MKRHPRRKTPKTPTVANQPHDSSTCPDCIQAEHIVNIEAIVDLQEDKTIWWIAISKNDVTANFGPYESFEAMQAGFTARIMDCVSLANANGYVMGIQHVILAKQPV